MKKHCCKDMEYYVDLKCDIHSDPFDCPDNIVVYNEMTNVYGIIIHDGGQSFIQITYCPWCGNKLHNQ